LRASDPAQRSAATAALRWLKAPGAEEALERLLTSDPDAKVRATAAFALSFHPMNAQAFAVEKRAFQQDSDLTVRLAALNGLWSRRNDQASVRNLLEGASRQDPSEEVRKAAAALLAAPGQPPAGIPN